MGHKSTRAVQRTPNSVPVYSLYGEAALRGQEILHIEEVQSRSRLYSWEIAAHRHQGLYQVVWVNEGEADVSLDEWRGVVDGPAAIVIPPNIVHGFRFAPNTDGLVLTFSQRLLLDGDFHSVGDAFRALFSTLGVMRFAAHDQQAVRLYALFRELLAEFELPGQPDSPVVGWLSRAVVWRLAQARAQITTMAAVRRPQYQALVTRFLLLVEAHFLEHWTLNQYASQLGVSPPRLNRLMRAESGHGALEIIHERLTREACRRLIFIAAPVSKLATELGFDDPAYFSRFFTRRTGLSPHRWRQKHLPTTK